ncbi:MAG: DUF2892 domain-containing protein [Sulfurospirillaceae bacterium]|nr:DUF2892 domain-containing protein [Sulfurospirillaceae bacterium]MCK9545565.1 DUF2892 domain-containing protein [Sulfurospirillaceae bacterium]NLM99540.1 DUF2892 domain-containing protein [Campylobacteraceae bacterium]
MRQNIGEMDRKVRLIIGVLLLVWGLISQNWFGLIGIVPIVTAVFRYCPLYSLFKK